MSTTCWLVVGVTLCAAVCATARLHVVSTTSHVLMVMPSAIMPPSVGHTTTLVSVLASARATGGDWLLACWIGWQARFSKIFYMAAGVLCGGDAARGSR